jgi:hypothetical protein
MKYTQRLSSNLKKWYLNEATDTSGGSGSYRVPISPGLKLWDKDVLEPFTIPLSNVDNAQIYVDSLDGNITTKDKSAKETIALRISRELKKRQENQDDDGLGGGRPSDVSGSPEGGDTSESGDSGGVSESVIKEDLGVWFGTKKKPKGSKQPKGPWVNICRRDKNGKHPPCGRSNATDKAYPKCRAAGVASKMTDSQKKSACAQKRKAEKSHPKSGTGNKPKMVSYKPRKESVSEAFKVKPDEYKKLLDNDKYLLVIPLTHTASCKYGARTKWCTTSRGKDLDFQFHKMAGVLAYLILRDPFLIRKFGSEKLAIFREDWEKHDEGRIYDELNHEYNLPWLQYMFEKIHRPQDYTQIMNKFDKYFYMDAQKDKLKEGLIRRILKDL